MVRNADFFKGLDMVFLRRMVVALVLFTFLCGGLFAQDIIDTYFNGDVLNRKINSYAANITSLIPDTTTLQNIWGQAPNGDFYFGVGVNASFAFTDRTQVSNIATGLEAFGADNIDLTQFPDGVPFLPAVFFDVRIGFGNFDFGLAGTWLDEKILEDAEIKFFGDGSTFALQSLGMDFRYSINRALSLPKFLPVLAVQAGYYFTRTTFGVKAEDAGRVESVKVDFRNDTLLLGAHASLNLMSNLLVPYAGIRVIFSTTHSDYKWSTNRPVMANGRLFYNGAKYDSPTISGDTEVSSQFYAGLGVNYLTYQITVGGAYNLDTEHFSINVAFRYYLGL